MLIYYLGNYHMRPESAEPIPGINVIENIIEAFHDELLLETVFH